MKFFNWGGDDDKPAESVSPGSLNPAAGPIALARENLSTELAKPTRTRGRSKNAETSGGDNRTLSPALAAEIEKQLEACYDPKAWAALITLPADAAHTFTGRDYWKASKDERETLGITASAAARTLMITNPRALAFLMLASAAFSFYVPRGILELKHHQEERKKKADAAIIKAT